VNNTTRKRSRITNRVACSRVRQLSRPLGDKSALGRSLSFRWQMMFDNNFARVGERSSVPSIRFNRLLRTFLSEDGRGLHLF
jgi:hypothetical protein